MAAFKQCKTCGVPLRIGRDHVWDSDGTISQRRDRDHRMILFDSEGIEALFTNIEQLIGIPIEKIVVESKGRVMGYGDIEIVEVNWKEMVMKTRIRNPYSLKLFCGDMRGATEAIRKQEAEISFEETEPDTFLVTTHHEPHAPELQGRLVPKAPPRKPGNIFYDLCPRCGLPLEISQFKWDTGAGTIIHKATGVRYAIFGPAGLQAIFDELERELGESIPEAIIEAQRIHVSSRMGKQWKAMGGTVLEGWLEGWLAMQGMGNLVSLETVEGGYTARMENPAVPLVLVGTATALFEFMAGSRAGLDWSLAEDGDLAFTLRAGS